VRACEHVIIIICSVATKTKTLGGGGGDILCLCAPPCSGSKEPPSTPPPNGVKSRIYESISIIPRYTPRLSLTAIQRHIRVNDEGAYYHNNKHNINVCEMTTSQYSTYIKETFIATRRSDPQSQNLFRFFFRE